MFSFVGGPYTDDITTITAATMNYLRGSYANAWDIISGGTYTPTTQTELTGTIGLKSNFSATGLQIAGLGGLHILSGSTGYVDSGGFLTVSSGGVATITGTMTTSGAGAITIANGGDLVIASGGEETVQSGGLLTAAAGSTVTLAGTSTVSGAMTVNATGTLTTNAASTSTFAGPITSTGANSLAGAQTLGAAATIVLSPARTGSRVQPFPKVNDTTLAVTYGVLSLAVSDAGEQAIDVDVGQTITAVAVSIDASVGGAMPASRATVSLVKRSMTGGSTVESLQDPLLVLGTYRTLHTLTLTLTTPYVALATETYYVRIEGESGANSQAIDWTGTSMTASKASINLDT